MKRFLRLACLLLACLMVVGTLTACDLTEVLDEMFQDDDHADRDDRYEDDEEEETKKKPSQRPADTEAETDSLERPEETTQWGDTWGEVETSLPQTEPDSSKDPFKDPFKDPVKDEPLSEEDAALKDLEVDFGGRAFGVLCDSSSYYEVYADNESKDGYAAQIINDAVYERNAMLESTLGVDIFVDQVNTGSVATVIKPMVAAGEDAYQMIDCSLGSTLMLATEGYLLKYGDMGVDLSGSWWDQGTAEFYLAENIYFMASSSNMWNNDVTYAIMFNKDMYAQYVVDNLYDVVRGGDWTLDYFNNVMQGIHADNGDGVWNEYDYYGFVTNYTYANAFFVGAGLRYVDNTYSDGSIAIMEADAAVSVLDLVQKIYHENYVTYMCAPGQENLGLDMFGNGRGLFYGDVLQYMKDSLRYADIQIGVLPLPKYDTNQTEYRSLSHAVGSVLSVPVSAYGGEEVGTIVQAYAVLSHKYVKPAYYNTYMAAVSDEDSMEMLDFIWGNRVYDLGLCHSYLDVSDFFYTVVNENSDTFVSQYKSRSRSMEKKLQTLLRKLY